MEVAMVVRFSSDTPSAPGNGPNCGSHDKDLVRYSIRISNMQVWFGCGCLVDCVSVSAPDICSTLPSRRVADPRLGFLIVDGGYYVCGGDVGCG